MLTRQQTSALRGIAILGIVLHNYTHWLGPMVKENEYTYSQHNVDRLVDVLGYPTWDIFAHLLSFFGHYGVPVFLFLSAYGLSMKYERSSNVPQQSPFSFIRAHYKKLWMMMIVGYAAFVMIDYMTPRPRHYEFWNVVGELGMFSNLYSEPQHAIWPGPFWYFGLMVQVYIVYRFLLYPGPGSLLGLVKGNVRNLLTYAFLVVPIVIQLFMEPESDALNWYRYNVFGALPPFVAGLLYARHKPVNVYPRLAYGVMLFVMLFIVFGGSLSFDMWNLVPLAVCAAGVCLVKAVPESWLSPMAWVGSISAAMFVSHPIARKIIIPISHRGDIYAGLVLYVLCAILLGILFKNLIDGINTKQCK